MTNEEILIRTEYNATTGEQIDRPFTEEEAQRYYQLREEFLAREAQREAQETVLAALKTSAKAKLIAGQPLTAEEADVLVI